MCQRCETDAAMPGRQAEWAAMPLQEVRAKALPLIAHYAATHGGLATDAEDIVQDALLIYLKQIENKLHLTVPPQVYVFGVGRNLLRKQIRGRALAPSLSLGDDVEMTLPEVAELPAEERVTSWLGQLTLRCQRLLFHFYYLAAGVEQIKQRLGYSSAHSVSAQKYKCLATLKEVAVR